MESSFGPHMILIVDDTPTNLEVLSEALTGVGLQVAVALDGDSALEQVEYHQPALILLDVMMPGIDGFETCRRLKTKPSTASIPVIFMTALSEAEHKVQGFNCGAVDYITKPFQQEEVLSRVKVHLQIHTLTQKLEAQNNLLKYFNESLEQKVQERTDQLQQAQIQIIQQEKLSALGELVAGVAHEINNPINFIYGNFPPAKDYIQDLLHLIDLYQNFCPEPSLEIQESIEEIDLEFLRLDLPKLLDSMQFGADRIREIVASLRNFSRLDEADFKRFDLHEGMDNTLMILGHRIKARPDYPEVEIIRNYGDLPLVTCFPGQLNQVFMNLLANAIDALESTFESAQSSFKPTIQISTCLLNQDWVEVRISDNGTGIPEGVLQRIFNPFFTTKPIGKGTGLGLSISHQIIVEKHQGKLSCDSKPNQGTEFIIEIPVQQPEPKHERFQVELQES